MSDYTQQSLTITHQNNGLFADYYLNEIVPTLPTWDDDALFAQAKRAFEQLADLRASIQPELLDEAQLEAQWIQPVLRLLGHYYAVQVKLRFGERGLRKPDYVFVETEDDARALTNAIYEPDALTHVLAVGDAKRWGTRLDQTTSGQRNPSQQIDQYLRYSERPWGILTDGRYWRLYHRETSKYNSYYAVDLESLLDSGNIHAFRYFYAFFRQEAFTTGWLDRVLAGSEDFAQKLTDKLEDEVYDALEMIAQGFLDYRRNRLDADPDTLHTIYEQSLVLLYRLLFIFYAESRAILPVDNADYRAAISMHSIKHEVAKDLRFSKTFDADSSRYYTRLLDLFFAIDAGHTGYDVPPYNGRLFSDAEHPFLANTIVGDAHLVPALDKLARVDDNGKRVFVDYRDLDIRHLGSIYEKLLEYELDVATQPLTTKGKEQRYAPAEADDAIVKQPGEVLLRTGSNERKITGSYYTPDYIVRFIVEKTLEPLLTAITERHATQDDEGNWQVHDADALVQDVLALNILDPATGSGHFVVDVTAYIAEWMRELPLRPAGLEDEDELLYWKRVVASACIYAVDINPLAVELAKLSMWLTTLAKGKPLSFLDHHIRVGNSLVGTRFTEIDDAEVDVKEEQKRRKRIARAEKKQREAEAAGQIPMFSDADFSAGVRFAVEQMNAIEATIADDVSDVKHQEQLYAELTKRLNAWQQAADVWTARYFGLQLTEEQWQAVRRYTTSGMIPPSVQDIVAEASAIADEQRFFHWELAFPEIFFDADGQPKAQPGFDAVVGNPPYVRQESITPIKDYLQTHYDEVYSGVADIYVYFYACGLEQLRYGGLLSYITPNKWFSAGYGEGLRGYLADNSHVRQIVDFGHSPIFRDVDTFPMIGVLSKASDQLDETEAEICDFPREELVEMVKQADRTGGVNLNRYVQAHGFHVPMARFSSDAWSLEPVEVDLLIQKIRDAGIPLRDYVGSVPNRGVTTGLNKAFVISHEVKETLVRSDPNSAEIIKPFLRGREIKRWTTAWDKDWLIFTRRGIEIDNYPAVKKHLMQYREELEPKPSGWKGLWKGRKPGAYKWFEIQDSVEYWSVFERPGIVHTDITWRPEFAISEGGYYLANTAYVHPCNDLYLLAVLNSPLMWTFCWRNATHGKDEALRMILSFMEDIPIAVPEKALKEMVESDVTREIELTRNLQQSVQEILDWLHIEFGVEKPGNKLQDFATISEDDFIAEVKKRSPDRLTPAGLHVLREQFAEYSPAIRSIEAERTQIEHRLSDLVNQAYGLTPEEIDLMWRTAPPRMPISPPSTRA